MIHDEIPAFGETPDLILLVGIKQTICMAFSQNTGVNIKIIL